MDNTTRVNDQSGLSIRTLLVSDVHLGCKHSRPREFLDFIRGFRPDNLYIVGDFIDGWKLKGWYWPSECDEIIDHLVMLVDSGTKLYYTPGNHDSFLRTQSFESMLPPNFPSVELADEFVFESLRGWRFLVTHGDLFDLCETRAQWISKGGSSFYDRCLSMNRLFQRLVLDEKRNPYGVCAVLKGRVKRGVRFISRYEKKIMSRARQRDCHGVICGHVHTPAVVHRGSVLYCNTGDWVENCTALIENHDGSIELLSKYSRNRALDLPDQNTLAAHPTESSTSSTEQNHVAIAQANPKRNRKRLRRFPSKFLLKK